MAKHSTWSGVEETHLDLSDWVPAPGPSAQELSALRAVLAEQQAAADHACGSGCSWDPADEDDLSWLCADDAVLAAPSVGSGEELAAGLREADRGLGLTTAPAAEAFRLSGGEVIDALTAAGQVAARAITLAFALAREAAARKLHLDAGLGLVDWLRVRCPHLHPGVLNDLATCARLAPVPGPDLVADALEEGRIAPHRGAKIARTLEQLQKALVHDPERARAYGRIAVEAAARPDLSDRDLGLVCAKLLRDLVDTPPDNDRESTQEALRTLTARPLGQGMTRYTIDAPTSDTVLIDGMLTGPLARPTPHAETGQPDLRSAGQRRYDAFRTVLSRGLGNPGGAPSVARASVMITVQADPETGHPVGVAQTVTGQLLTAAEAGRFACVGDLTPVALGPFGEPLALGRTERLATPGQFKALIVRDQHCTFPGCSVPGTWCEAHHVIWWCRAGDTDIGLLALLCPRHHTVVHEKDLAASVVGAVVTWHT